MRTHNTSYIIIQQLELGVSVVPCSPCMGWVGVEIWVRVCRPGLQKARYKLCCMAVLFEIIYRDRAITAGLTHAKYTARRRRITGVAQLYFEGNASTALLKASRCLLALPFVCRSIHYPQILSYVYNRLNHGLLSQLSIIRKYVLVCEEFQLLVM